MWSPTHVQVTVQRAKGLLIKGKNGKNDCFVTIGLGKEKFETSVKEKSQENVEWHEECDLMIPSRGNTAEVVLTVLHRNFIGDQFLGQVTIPLASLDVYERPRNRWVKLEGKSGKENTKERGELEVKIGFTVKEGKVKDLKKEKHLSSMGQLSLAAQNMGGSLLSIGSLEKRKGLKKFAKNLGSKININKKEKKTDSSSLGDSALSLQNTTKSLTNSPMHAKSGQAAGQADPGVISEDEDEFAFDDLSHKSSGSSLNVNNTSTLPRASKFTQPFVNNPSLENLGGGELLRRSTSGGIKTPDTSPPPKPVRLGLEEVINAPKPAESIQKDEWSQKLLKGKVQSQLLLEKEKSMATENKSVENLATLTKEKNNSPKFFKKFSKDKSKKNLGERIIIGEEGIIDEVKVNTAYSKLPKDIVQQYETKSREDLVVMAWSLQNEVDNQKKKVKDLENYLDELLLRVMETTPRILQNPYSKNIKMRLLGNGGSLSNGRNFLNLSKPKLTAGQTYLDESY